MQKFKVVVFSLLFLVVLTPFQPLKAQKDLTPPPEIQMWSEITRDISQASFLEGLFYWIANFLSAQVAQVTRSDVKCTTLRIDPSSGEIIVENPGGILSVTVRSLYWPPSDPRTLQMGKGRIYVFPKGKPSKVVIKLPDFKKEFIRYRWVGVVATSIETKPYPVYIPTSWVIYNNDSSIKLISKSYACSE